MPHASVRSAEGFFFLALAFFVALWAAVPLVNLVFAKIGIGAVRA